MQLQHLKYIVLLLSVVVSANAMPSLHSRHIHIVGARYIFGISPAPRGLDIFFYWSDVYQDGEFVTGAPALVTGVSGSGIVRFGTPTQTDDGTVPVWSQSGTMVYFETDKGIYSFNVETRKIRLVVSGALAGLALSKDGTLLAYWDLGVKKREYYLRVINSKTHDVIRTWRVADRNESDHYGDDIAFQANSDVVARAYDKESQTPLKRFDLKTGAVQTISRDCSSVAASDNSIYYTAMTSGGRSALFEIDGFGIKTRAVLEPFRFDRIAIGGNKRWLVARNSQSSRVAIYDTKSGKFWREAVLCESMGVLSDGRVVCARDGGLSISNPIVVR